MNSMTIIYPEYDIVNIRSECTQAVEKGEIDRNKQFLHFPCCFLPVWNLKLSSAKSFNLEESKICCLGNG